jgi:hypothetical protein
MLRVRVRIVMIAVAVVALGLGLDRITYTIADGFVPLQIALKARSDRHITAVASQVLSRHEEAEFLLTHPDHPELALDEVPWSEGQPLTIQVPVTRYRSILGRELSYFQFRALLLRATHADGASRFVVVKIPDARIQTRVDVTID